MAGAGAGLGGEGLSTRSADDRSDTHASGAAAPALLFAMAWWGGVCGIPGWQAARAALSDKKRGLKRFRRS